MALDEEPKASLPEVPLLDTLFELMPRLSWSSEQLRAYQCHALTQVLQHASRYSTFHRERLADVDLESVTIEQLDGLPTMTKRDLMTNWDDVTTIDRLTLAAARAHLEQLDHDGFTALDDEYLVLTTGGSTGEPAIFCWSLEEMARFGASSLRWSAAQGQGPPTRPAWVAAGSPRHPSHLAALMTGATLVPIDQPLAMIVEQLNAAQPDALSTVCSLLPLLTEEARHGRLHTSFERINVFGDVLDRAAAMEALEVFGVEPTEGYPTTDVGYIAQQAPGESGLYLNEDLLLVETVDENDRPVPPGSIADHLLVTSLHQRTTPLIRYRIEDRVIVDPEPGRYPAYRRLESIDGRSDEVFRYGELAIHPHVFRTALGRQLEIVDYEVTQRPRGALVRVVASGSIDRDGLHAELVDRLRRAGLPSPDVEIAVVDEIPRTAVGKRRRFIPCSG